MNHWASAWVVAKWEFARYFKLKSEIISILLWVAISGMLWGGQALISRFQESDTPQLILIDAVGLTLPTSSALTLEPTDLPLSQALTLAEEQQFDGVLQVTSLSEATLHTENNDVPTSVSTWLNSAALDLRLHQAGISADEFAALSTPMTIRLAHRGAVPERTAFEKALAVVVLALVLVGVFTGFSYFFVSITSEKQQRVSEQIISAISAQAWTDGKIIGLTALSLKSVLAASIWGALGFLVYQRFGSDSGLSVLQSGVDPGLLALLILFALLGIALWSAFYAMVAATISDPNSSSRSAIMLIPIIPVMFGFAALGNTDSSLAIALSWFPLTSFVFMPARLMTQPVPAWDWLLSSVLLVLTIMVLRIAAGRVLNVAMLMFGQEPGWRDIWRWTRSRPSASPD